MRVRWFTPPRFWIVGLVALGVSALMMVGLDDLGMPAEILANSGMMVGFWLFWMGLRALDGLPLRPRMVVLACAASTATMVAAAPIPDVVELVYIVAQAIPWVAGMDHLLRGPRSGRSVALAGIGLGLAAHGVDFWVHVGVAFMDGDPARVAQVEELASALRLFSGVVWQIGLATIAFAAIYRATTELADEDPLTGLWNRRRFEQELQQAYRQAKTTGAHFCVLLVDVNNFKTVNDRFGHLVGDQALRRVAACLRSNVRRTDSVARIGGDEFAILLPDTHAIEAERLCARVRGAIAENTIDHDGQRIPVTYSVGVGAWHPDDSRVEDALQRADNALYADKHDGKRDAGLTTTDDAPA